MNIIGPVDFRIFGFPGNKFEGRILPELRRLMEDGTVRVLDLVFITRDRNGILAFADLEDLDDAPGFELVANGVISEEDIDEVAGTIEPNSSVALIAWENLWAVPLTRALMEANADVLAGGHVPREIVQEATADLAVA